MSNSSNRAYTKLQLSIKDIVYDDIPLSLHCTNCDTELDATTIIDKDTDASKWSSMADNIIAAVVEQLPDIIKEVA